MNNSRTPHRINASYRLNCVATAIFATLLVACGGGGGSDNAATTTNIGLVTVSAGPNKTITLPETRVELAGTAPGALAQWSQVSGPALVAFKSTTTAVTSVMADKPGVYVLQMTASDTAGAAKTSQVSVLVNPSPIVISASSTPLDYLKSVAPPAFKQGHTLLPLTQSSCGISQSISLELMKNWGYTAQFSGFKTGVVADALLAAPGRYPIEVTTGNLYGIYDNFDGNNPNLPVLPDATYLRDVDGDYIDDQGAKITDPKKQRRVVSPAAPDSVLAEVGEFVGRQAAQVEAALGQPIKIITNSGEYGLSNFGESSPNKTYVKDPVVMKAYKASNLDWYQYNARERARHERLIKEAIIRPLKKGTPAYLTYQETYGTERGRWFGWKNYNSLYEYFIGPDKKPLVSDYTGPESYFQFHNSGWSGIEGGAMVPWDMLTQALKNMGGAIKLGQRNVYPWVSLGWDKGDSGGKADNDMYMGMMKSYYVAGALGAVSGYFSCIGPEFEGMINNKAVVTDPPTPISTAPTQIRGMYLLGHAHALFTHLEEYLREGDLLPGNGMHPYKANGEEPTPSYEFAAVGETTKIQGMSGMVTVPTARVLARKIKNQDRWLISAWANTGNDREVRVTIDPKLGEMKLRARKAGSVYVAELKNGVTSLRLVDQDGMNPTRMMFP